MFNGNLLKYGTTNLQDSEKRIIDTNELVNIRLAENKEKRRRAERRPHKSDPAAAENSDEFAPGLSAETVESPVADGAEDGDETAGNVIKAGESREIIAQAEEEAQRILDQTWARAKEECDKLREDTLQQLAVEREQTIEQAREQGYSEGREQAERELEAERGRLQEQLRQAEEEYQRLLDEMEPRFIDTITGIYEHIFQVDLESYRNILVHLIGATMRKIEGSRDFLVHVSKDDYPYVSMQKKQIMAEAASPNSSVEIIEDITLSKNECMIETEGGIFDCGLGTQMEELGRKLKLLSYEK